MVWQSRGSRAKALTSRSLKRLDSCVWGCAGWEGNYNHGFTLHKVILNSDRKAHVTDSVS